MMKKAIALLLALVMLLSLAACAPKEPDAPAADAPAADAPATDKEVTLNVLSFFDAMTYGEEYEKAWEWVAEQTGYNIIVDSGGTDAHKTKREVYLANGEIPDIMSMPGGAICEPFIEKGLMAVADEYLDNSEYTFLPAYRQPANDGHEYRIPVTAGNTTFLLYNKEILAQYGLEPPKTLDDLIEMAAVLEGSGISAIGTGASNQWLTTFIFMAACVRANPTFYSEVAADKKWDDGYDTFYAAAEKIVEMVDQGLFNVDALAIDVPTMNAMFQSGQYATIMEGGWRWAGMYDAMGDNLGYISFPDLFGDAAYDDYATVNPSQGNTVSATSEFKDEAFEACILYSYYINEYLAKNGLLTIMETETQPEVEVYEDYQKLVDDMAALKGSTITWADLLDPAAMADAYAHTTVLFGGSAAVPDVGAWTQTFIDIMNSDTNLGGG